MSERGWEGMGRLSIEGAAKYGHIRKDLRNTQREIAPSEEVPASGILRSLARHIINLMSTSDRVPIDLSKHYE